MTYINSFGEDASSIINAIGNSINGRTAGFINSCNWWASIDRRLGSTPCAFYKSLNKNIKEAEQRVERLKNEKLYYVGCASEVFNETEKNRREASGIKDIKQLMFDKAEKDLQSALNDTRYKDAKTQCDKLLLDFGSEENYIKQRELKSKEATGKIKMEIDTGYHKINPSISNIKINNTMSKYKVYGICASIFLILLGVVCALKK